MPKINQSVETMVIDQYGEFVEKRANKTLSWGAEPNFVKLYLNDVVYMSDLPSSNAAVLHQLIGRATYAGEANGMQIIINKYVKEQVKNKLGYKSIGSVENAITQLVKGKILYRIDRGVYNLNPYLFGKGDWQDICRLRLEVNYDDIKGKTFKAVCEYVDKPNALAPEEFQALKDDIELKGQMNIDQLKKAE